MREWLRGGAPPCQGGGRGFESRLALFFNGWNSLDLQGVPAFCVLQNVVDSCRHFSFCPVGEKAVWFDPRLALFLLVAEVLIYKDFRYICVSFRL